MNQEIARIFLEMAELLEMQDIPFKPRAYERAADSVSALSGDIKEIYRDGGIRALMKIPGVGRGIAEKIEEYVKTGRVREHAALKKDMPVDIAGLTRIEGVGPKVIRTLYETLGVRTVHDLEKAARSGKISALPHFGKKSEEKILKGIGFLRTSGTRLPLGEAFPIAESLAGALRKVPGAEEVVVAGSFRRWKETVGDLDIIVVSKKPQAVAEAFVSLPRVQRVIAQGTTKSSVKLKNGLNVDLRVIPRASFGAALHYFTGSKEHNVALREIAVKRGLKLNEYGLFRGKRQIAGETEEGVYRALGLSYVPPEMRENLGEIALARRHRLPSLIEYGDLRGDLQTQTDWTDGRHSIREMVSAAKQRGLEYIVITDHTKSLAMTGGADEKKLLRQMAEIDRINRDLRARGDRFRVLKGAEVNIMPDGSLDIADEVLAKLDCVGAAVHTNFKLTKEEQTARLVRAMENPNVDIIFHPTGRLIARREPIALDIEAVIRAAKRTRTILEIDAHPERLDLKDEHIRLAREAEVSFSIDSDAHSAAEFDLLRFGIAQARRAWCEKKDIINTLPVQKMLSSLK